MVLALAKSGWTQFYPPSPTFTESDVTSQAGKVFIITGGNSGVGFELIRMLYPTGATIYMASRSQQRAEAAIKTITSSDPSKASYLKFLFLDLDDLTTIPASAAAFAAQESRLDVLWNNAGIGAVAVGTRTKQNIEAHIGVNCVGPLLFTQHLLPQLRAAAKSAPKDSVRIVWTGSWMVESYSPKGGVDFQILEQGGKKDPRFDYAVSKVGNWMLAVEAAKRYGSDGIISVVQNPGNLDTPIYRYQPKLTMMILNTIFLHKPILGAYTMLYAGFSPDITAEEQGAYIIPWGRIQKLNSRTDIYDAIEKGGAEKFWNWCEEKWETIL